MEKITLPEYKDFLIRFHAWECDNDEECINERRVLLSKRYSDEFLAEAIDGTYSFIKKILELSAHDYHGFLDIPLEYEPQYIDIDLDLKGGWPSDTIIKDNNGNCYSLELLTKTFGDYFLIEPCKTEFIERFDEEDAFGIFSYTPIFFTYIQCSEDTLNGVRKSFLEDVSRELKK